MCCNKPIDYKMLTMFSPDMIAWLYGEEGTGSHILAYINIGCAIFMALCFGWKIKIFGSIFLACKLTFWSDSHS